MVCTTIGLGGGWMWSRGQDHHSKVSIWGFGGIIPKQDLCEMKLDWVFSS